MNIIEILPIILHMTSVVTDSESATESADSSRVRPSPNPRIFCGRNLSDGFGSSVRESIFTYQLAVFKRHCITVPPYVCGRRCSRVGD